MKAPSHETAYQVLLLQAASDGRGPVLFGDSLDRARAAALPFMVGKRFPSVYLEHPLVGAPFLDVTILYDEVDPGTRIASDAATGTEAMLDWYAGVRRNAPEITFGFEIDTKHPDLPAAAVHFQPHSRAELVTPFFEAAGEPDRARLYHDQAARMPAQWSPAFFGMFRGRPESPLRVCGYLSQAETRACAADPRHLAKRFDEIGFEAYDDVMLRQVSRVMGAAPQTADFQIDVLDDGSLGPVFSVDVSFCIERPELVRASFASGAGANVMGIFEEWGAADDRWRLVADAAFARAIPVELDDGTSGNYSFTLMPHWAKARWADGVLQPAKLYHFANAGLIEDATD